MISFKYDAAREKLELLSISYLLFKMEWHNLQEVEPFVTFQEAIEPGQSRILFVGSRRFLYFTSLIV